MAGIELVVIVVAVLLTQQRQVGLTDDDRTSLSEECFERSLRKHCPGILQGFIEVAEARHLHAVQWAIAIDRDIEITHQIAGKVVLGQAEEQLVLVDGIGVKHEHKYKVRIALVGEFTGLNGVAVAEHGTAPAPHVPDVELSAPELPTLVHSVDDHACHLAHTALRILLDHLLQVVKTTLGIACIEFAQGTDEEELVAIGPQREALGRELGIGLHLSITIGFEGLVGSSIERIFQVNPEAGILGKMRIGEQCRPLALGTFLLQAFHIALGDSGLVSSRVKQEEMIEHVVHVLIFGVLSSKAQEIFFTELQIVEFILEDDAGLAEAVHYNGIAGLHLFGREGYLSQIVLTTVGITGCAVGFLLQGVLGSSLTARGRRIGCRPVSLAVGRLGHHGFVRPLPVVLIRPLAPTALELSLALAHRHRIIKVPLSALTSRSIGILPHRAVVAHALPEFVARIGSLSVGSLLLGICSRLLFLLLLQSLYYTVDSGIALLLAHLGECLE